MTVDVMNIDEDDYINIDEDKEVTMKLSVNHAEQQWWLHQKYHENMKTACSANDYDNWPRQSHAVTTTVSLTVTTNEQ